MPKLPVESVTIVGFGLIGASLAAALKERASQIVVNAIDLPRVAADPEARSRVDALVSLESEARCRELVAGSDLTVLASPVRIIEEQLQVFLPHARIVTDCGSTKRSIVASLRGRDASHFVPGHPMAGKTVGGFAAASGELFAGRPWILCPEGCSPEALERVRAVVRFVDAEPAEMSAEDHDRAVALTSHLPKLLAGLLVRQCHTLGAESARGPAFLGATRVASGDVGIWRDILETNADQVAVAAERLSRELAQLSESLGRGDLEPTLELLEAARRLKR